MNNLLSYCGLVDARVSASEKDLPVSSPTTKVHQTFKEISVFCWLHIVHQCDPKNEVFADLHFFSMQSCLQILQNA